LIAEAERKVSVIFEEYHRLESQAQIFKMRFRSFLETQLKILEGEHAQALEFFPLDLYVFQGKFLALLPEFHRGDLMTVQTEGFDGLLLNGQAVGIPARYIRRVITGHGVVLYDNIL
jgi:hypothetical protein